MTKGIASSYRLWFIALVVVGCFAGIGVRLVDLHVWNREELASHADRVRRSITIEPARRGDILDARGDVLATSRSLIALGVDPQVLRPEDEARWPELAQLIGMPLEELTRIFTTKGRTSGVVVGADETDPLQPRLIRWAKLHDAIEESTYAEILRLGIRGVYGNRTYRRTYPRNQLAAHLIGFVNHEMTPAMGVERFADFYLRGLDGWRETERDGLRRELAQFRSREVPPRDGYKVVLSIDSVVQHLLEVELDRVARELNPKQATIIVSDARSGFVLGLANYPTFDLNQFNRAPIEVQRNIAVTDLIDPGSTFKIVPAAGALERGLVTPQTRFNCNLTSIEWQGRTRRFMADSQVATQPLSVVEIIAKSSNVGAAQLAMLLGERGLYEVSRNFGFGERSGFPFGGEVAGLLNPPERWSALEITRIPAGYSVSATPLQLHYAMGAIASHGELHLPQVIREIRDDRDQTVYDFGGVSRRRVMSEQVARQMAAMLQRVVSEDGTARTAAIPGYQVAGKTGTAQKLIDGRYSARHHVGSFIGFFPASDPTVVISVIIDEARLPAGRTAYGGTVAVPSFKRVAEQLIPYLDIKPVIEPGRSLLAMQGGRP
jgi:cell division protein FtsI/penicillin-binding protein 2